MKKYIILTIIALSVLVGIDVNQQVLGYYSSEPTSSHNFKVTITSDKESYNIGEIITFSGNVSTFDESRLLQVTMFDPSQKIVLNEKIQVNPDGTFYYDITGNDKIKTEGEYSIRAQYGTTNTDVQKISFTIHAKPVSALESTADIPAWIKNNAGWWANGQIDDNSFVQGIQFLIKEKMMSIPPTAQGASSGGNEIPAWIKNNAGWWANGQIDDNSFVQGIQFLIKDGIITIEQNTE